MIVQKLAKALKSLYDNPLIINAYVNMADGQVRSTNWGDDINYHFIKHLSKREIAIYFDTPIAMALKRTNYLCIGSTLNYLSTRRSVVWGAGVIDDALELRERPLRIHAVRGPHTRNYLLARGIDCPDVYGDPALLIPYFYRPAVPAGRQKGRIGIVPHYSDWSSPILAKIKATQSDVDVIDIVNYGNWTDFVDSIYACDTVFSSSLHGLITAEAFGIANHWIHLSDQVIGNGFKFEDFFSSIGKPTPSSIKLNNASRMKDLAAAYSWKQGKLNLKRLLDACPFEIKEPVRHEHPMDL